MNDIVYLIHAHYDDREHIWDRVSEHVVLKDAILTKKSHEEDQDCRWCSIFVGREMTDKELE